MLTINAEKRLEKGTCYSRRLRMSNKFPGILYGKEKFSISMILDHDIVFNLQKNIEFYQENLFLFIEGKKYTVKVKEIQRHPFKLKLLHIDFLYV